MSDPQEKEQEFKEYHFTVPGGHTSGTRLDKYIATFIQNVSRTKVQKAIEGGYVTVNGEVEKSSYNMEPGDQIDIHLPIPKPPEAKAEKMELDIVYEDDDLLIVNKEAGVVVHPAYGNWTGTLVNGLMWHTGELSDPDSENIRPGIVHRIDKDTSGILVVAKNDETHRKLSEYFRTKDIERTYWAIIWGTPDQKEGTITGDIGRNRSDRKKMAVVPNGRGKHAVTHYKVLEYYDHLTLVEARLETGRTHQIRVHFANERHWVLGDHKYGGNSVRYGPNTGSRKQMFRNLMSTLKGQCLHAKTLGFEHPTTGEMVEFDSPLPPDFARAVHMLQQNCKPTL